MLSCMNPVKIAVGFVPLVLFSVLVGWIPVGWAALAGLAAALVLVAVTARGGIKILPVAQSVILAALVVAGFLGGPFLDAVLKLYGRGLASLLLGLFIVATAASVPFTAQFARAMVPSSAWNSPEFLAVNRRISLAWGYAVLVLGACHLVAAYLELHHVHPVIGLFVAWAVPILALLWVIAYTRRVAEGHAPSPQPART
jgi:hypothetical protein